MFKEYRSVRQSRVIRTVVRFFNARKILECGVFDTTTQIYEAVVEPILVRNAEKWRSDKTSIHMVEMGFLRRGRVYSIKIRSRHKWRDTTTNGKSYQKYTPNRNKTTPVVWTWRENVWRETVYISTKLYTAEQYEKRNADDFTERRNREYYGRQSNWERQMEKWK